MQRKKREKKMNYKKILDSKVWDRLRQRDLQKKEVRRKKDYEAPDMRIKLTDSLQMKNLKNSIRQRWLGEET